MKHTAHSRLAALIVTGVLGLSLIAGCAGGVSTSLPGTVPGTPDAAADSGQTSEKPEGLTLIAPIGSRDTSLIDSDGTVVHSWSSKYVPALSTYLLENDTLMRTAALRGPGQSFDVGGAGGRVEQWSRDGRLLWEFEYSDTEHRLHHDIEVLPNGNVLMIAWELIDRADAIAKGRDPDLLGDGALWPDHIIEVDPTNISGGDIIWEWHAWDHLVQDYDSGKDDYGVVADHPESIDVNYVSGRESADWTHINSIDYNPDLDQILLSVHGFNEIWIIDHSTTTAEAASHSGGDSDCGGDLLYRWGNPQAYDTGTSADRTLFGQHDAGWIENGLPGEGDILVFNNGSRIAGRAYSSVDEIVPPLKADGSYSLMTDRSYGPVDLAWQYTSDPTSDFYADHISGSQRLANGNTLITDGTSGTLFEVTTTGEIVWKYDVGEEIFRANRY
ncbi:MAG: aryl-sulfate sulfotransferase [Coriobacteriia bacterium]|nr:aryl-sulfate sulfotransferase [Coriobacteriia bacterium]